MRIGDNRLCLHTLSDAEDLPGKVATDTRYEKLSTDRSDCRLSFASPVGLLLSCNHIYNQYVLIDNSEETLQKFEKSARNMQREDLNSVEIALAYQHLLEQYGLTQERLSERIGKKRTTIANYLRLLKLPAPVQMGLQNKQIDMGHARALVTLGDPKLQVKIFEEILEQGYSVRKVEEIVKSLSEGEAVKSGGRKIAPKRAKLPEEFNMLKQQLSSFFSTKVQLTCSEKGKGKISIPFSNEEELERIIGILDTLKK
jgi:ParB family chromosome partitioning protein